MAYRFLVCEFKTGKVLEEVPLQVASPLDHVLNGAGRSGRVMLPVTNKRCPENWEQLILPWRSLILALDEQDAIVYAGVPTDRYRDGGNTPNYPLTTVAGYFSVRQVPTRAYINRDQTAIARDLAAIAGDAAGIPLEYDCPPSGQLRDRTYADDENATVYDRLQELCAVENGFDWTVDVSWTDDTHSRVKYTFRAGYPHLGNRSTQPNHVFELTQKGGNIDSYNEQLQWSRGAGATWVRAIGDGDAEMRTLSAPVIDTLRETAGWPRIEVSEKFDKVTRQSTIDDHAAGMAARKFGGLQVVDFSVRDGQGTSLRDLTLGDSARVHLDTPEIQLETTLVVVGWSIERDASTFTPTLAYLGG